MTGPIDSALIARSEGKCELCRSTAELTTVAVSPRADAIVVCAACETQLSGALDAHHWFCLQETAWSEHPAVQVTAWRLLNRLEEPWAKELLEQLYLDEDTSSWAAQHKVNAGAADESPKTVDSNGTELHDGDSVTLIKDLDVKGGGFTAKRGTLVKGIKLGGDPELVEGRVQKMVIYLRTEFLKRAGS